MTLEQAHRFPQPAGVDPAPQFRMRRQRPRFDQQRPFPAQPARQTPAGAGKLLVEPVAANPEPFLHQGGNGVEAGVEIHGPLPRMFCRRRESPNCATRAPVPARRLAVLRQIPHQGPMLATQIYGDDTSAPPVLIVHGLFGSGRNWGVIAKRLSDSRRVVTVDMRNHGASHWEETHSYHDLAADLAEVVEAVGGRADVIGHSMGGKGAMMLGLDQPERVRRLLVADIAPVSYAHTQVHLVHAMRQIDLTRIATRADADRILSEAIEERDVRAFLLQSLDVRAQRWLLNLDVLERDMELITGFPAVSGRFDGPALFLAGARSDYVLPQHRAVIKRLFPAAHQARIPGAGHWLHAEKPREFEAAARAFLNG